MLLLQQSASRRPPATGAQSMIARSSIASTPARSARWLSLDVPRSQVGPVGRSSRPGPGSVDVNLSPRVVTTGAIPAGAVWSTSSVVVGGVALDWLTLTTYSAAAFQWALRFIGQHTAPSDRVRAKAMQYDGLRGDGWFCGTAIQGERLHYMVRLSGSVAQSFAVAALSAPGNPLADFKCTRADVQYTHNEVPSVRLEVLGQALEVAEWPSHRGARPQVSWFHNPDGLDTLYIGSRSSRRLQRIYVKPVGDETFLRWEVEYKGELASNLWDMLLSVGVASLAGVLSGEMAVIPLAVVPELASLADCVNAPPERLKLRRDNSTAWSSVLWLWSSVLPCVRRLQSEDATIQLMVRQFLTRAMVGDDVELPPLPAGYDIDRYLSELEVS